MPQTIQIRRGTKAQLDSRGALLSGEYGFCTDTKEVFIGTGTENILVGRALKGDYISRPNAAVEGRFYFVSSGTNLGYLYYDDGSIWHRINAQKLTDLTGTIDDIADGSTFAKVKKADITNGQVNKVSDGTNTVTASEARTHINDASKHRVINDSSVTNTNLWSAQKIQNEIELARRGIEYQDSVKDKDLTTPPASPAAKDRYIVKATAAGAWVGKENSVAEWNSSAWEFYAPEVGTTVYVDDEKKQYSWNGTSWAISGGALQTVTAGNGLIGGGQADTVTINVGAGNGIVASTDTVSAKAGNGITVDATGINTNVDASTIIINASNKLQVSLIDGGSF
ncbi:hypothetical protein JOC70_000355 [Clostridium pascui]|uniref:DUF2793 domain-containing protein n=1 Tax=Clostridium pascui TaxID=46609 RepID=UPI00195E5516|nr:DUF2793 domain-containing protein [Clostridium pascui]MBM7868886.1 hypothetical protein [Clostridium pascui]